MDRIFTTFRSRYNKENFKKSRNIARIRTEGFRRNGFTTGVSKLSVWNPKIDSDRRDKIDTDRPRLYSKEVEYNKRQTADIPSFRWRSNPEGEVLSGEKPREIDQPLMLLTSWKEHEKSRQWKFMDITEGQWSDRGNFFATISFTKYRFPPLWRKEKLAVRAIVDLERAFRKEGRRKMNFVLYEIETSDEKIWRQANFRRRVSGWN